LESFKDGKGFTNPATSVKVIPLFIKHSYRPKLYLCWRDSRYSIFEI